MFLWHKATVWPLITFVIEKHLHTSSIMLQFLDFFMEHNLSNVSDDEANEKCVFWQCVYCYMTINCYVFYTFKKSISVTTCFQFKWQLEILESWFGFLIDMGWKRAKRWLLDFHFNFFEIYFIAFPKGHIYCDTWGENRKQDCK